MARELNFLRYFLITGVIILGISGVIVTVYAGYFIHQLHEYAPLTPENVCGCPSVLLAMGVITCLLSWSTWQFMDFTNKCQVLTCAVSLMLISFTETSAGIWALIRHEEIDTFPIKGPGYVFTPPAIDNNTAWNHVQSNLYCCGLNGPNDYDDRESIPLSCCNTAKFKTSNNSEGTCVIFYERGCFYVVINQTRSILLRTFLLALCSVLLKVCVIASIFSYVQTFSEAIENRKQRLMMIKELSEQTNGDANDHQKLNAQQA